MSTPNVLSLTALALAWSGQLIAPGMKMMVMLGPKLLMEGLLEKSDKFEVQILKLQSIK